MTERQLQKLQEWREYVSSVLEHPNGDDTVILGRSDFRLIEKLVDAELERQDAAQGPQSGAGEAPGRSGAEADGPSESGQGDGEGPGLDDLLEEAVNVADQ